MSEGRMFAKMAMEKVVTPEKAEAFRATAKPELLECVKNCRETFDRWEQIFGNDCKWCHDVDDLEFDLFNPITDGNSYSSLDADVLFYSEGMLIYPLERDSFGWVIGCVEDLATGHEIVFG